MVYFLLTRIYILVKSYLPPVSKKSQKFVDTQHVSAGEAMTGFPSGIKGICPSNQRETNWIVWI